MASAIWMALSSGGTQSIIYRCVVCGRHSFSFGTYFTFAC